MPTLKFYPGLEVVVPSQTVKPDTSLYLAGPLGFAEGTRGFHAQLVQLLTLMGVAVLDPWSQPPATPSIIAQRNIDLISQSNGVVAVPDGTDVDSGTAAEIGIAHARNKRVLGYRGDNRISTDHPDTLVNLQLHACLTLTISSVRNLPAAVLQLWG